MRVQLLRLLQPVINWWDQGRILESEQSIRPAPYATNGHDTDQQQQQTAQAQDRAGRVNRVYGLALNQARLRHCLDHYAAYDRAALIRDGYLLASAPAKGRELITAEFRTAKGEALLMRAKDLLFGLLFGDESMNVQFDRVQRELLTLTLPRVKANALDFLQATTELAAVGTWRDPDSVSHDARADNVVLEVEYGEVEGEWIGEGIVCMLSLINSLAVNEQILYARMVNIEQSTLIV